MALDPLQLSAATALEDRQQGLPQKGKALAKRVELALHGGR